VTINPTSDLNVATAYHVEIAPEAILDLASNPFAGISDPAKLTFATEINQVIYSNNFDGQEFFSCGTSGGLSGYISIENVQGFAADGFYGNFLRNNTGPFNGIPPTATTLTLFNLPAHNVVDINFLLAFIDSWDSNNGVPCGPDYFNVTVDGVNVLQITAAIAEGSITYSGHQLGGIYGRGFSDWPDIAFDMSPDPLLTVTHSASTLTIQLFASGGGWQGDVDESWAVENLQVLLDTGAGDLTAPTLVGNISSGGTTNMDIASDIVLTFSRY